MEQHQKLASGSWQRLTLLEQLGNIGGEVSRTRLWEGRDEKIFKHSAERALELFDLTLEDPRWRGRQNEIARAREVFCDTVYGDKKYGASLESLTRYFNEFAYASRNVGIKPK